MPWLLLLWRREVLQETCRRWARHQVASTLARGRGAAEDIQRVDRTPLGEPDEVGIDQIALLDEEDRLRASLRLAKEEDPHHLSILQLRQYLATLRVRLLGLDGVLILAEVDRLRIAPRPYGVHLALVEVGLHLTASHLIVVLLPQMLGHVGILPDQGTLDGAIFHKKADRVTGDL